MKPSSTGLLHEPGLRWLDVGCGNGAFTEMLVERCAPSLGATGIDPSEAQLAYARTRAGVAVSHSFIRAMRWRCRFPDDTFDAAVMPLVIFFVPDPGQGRRRNGASGLPGRHRRRLRVGHASAAGFLTRRCRLKCVRWALLFRCRRAATRLESTPCGTCGLDAGLEAVETREITVQRTFADFDDYWTTILGGPSVGPTLAAMASEDLAVLKARMRARLPADAAGRITVRRGANAVKGRVPR